MAFTSTKSNRLPARGQNVGDVFLATDTGNCYLVIADLSLLNLSAMLANPPHNVTVGPQGPPGRDGRDGESIAGPSGPQGPAGKDGQDSHVAGPRGEKGDTGERGLRGERGERGSTGPQGQRGAKGEKGDKGERGDVLYVGPEEIKAAARQLHDERARLHAKIDQAIQDAAGYPAPHRKLLQQPLRNLKQSIS